MRTLMHQTRQNCWLKTEQQIELGLQPALGSDSRIVLGIDLRLELGLKPEIDLQPG